MANESAMADAIRRLAIQYQQMTEAADLLESIGAGKSFLASLEIQKEAGVRELDKLNGDISDAESKLSEHLDKHAQVVSASDEHRTAKMQEAAEEADKIVREARVKAENIASSLVTDQTSLLDNLKKNITRSKSELKKVVGQLDESTVSLATKQSEFDEISSKVADIKQTLAKMLG